MSDLLKFLAFGGMLAGGSLAVGLLMALLFLLAAGAFGPAVSVCAVASTALAVALVAWRTLR